MLQIEPHPKHFNSVCILLVLYNLYNFENIVHVSYTTLLFRPFDVNIATKIWKSSTHLILTGITYVQDIMFSLLLATAYHFNVYMCYIHLIKFNFVPSTQSFAHSKVQTQLYYHVAYLRSGNY